MDAKSQKKGGVQIDASQSTMTEVTPQPDLLALARQMAMDMIAEMKAEAALKEAQDKFDREQALATEKAIVEEKAAAEKKAADEKAAAELKSKQDAADAFKATWAKLGIQLKDNTFAVFTAAGEPVVESYSPSFCSSFRWFSAPAGTEWLIRDGAEQVLTALQINVPTDDFILAFHYKSETHDESGCLTLRQALALIAAAKEKIGWEKNFASNQAAVIGTMYAKRESVKKGATTTAAQPAIAPINLLGIKPA
jgi:hypothetical protein